jgi:hypothetical protein
MRSETNEESSSSFIQMKQIPKKMTDRKRSEPLTVVG